MITSWLTLEQHMMEGSPPWPFPFLFLVSFQQYFLFAFFADSKLKYILVPCKWDSNRSHSWKNMLMLFLIISESNVLLFHHFHFQFCNLLTERDKKSLICVLLDTVKDGQSCKRICMTEWEWRKRMTETKRIVRREEMFSLCSTWKTVRNTDKAITWQDFTYSLQPLKDTWRPSMVTNWEKTSSHNGVVMTDTEQQIFWET